MSVILTEKEIEELQTEATEINDWFSDNLSKFGRKQLSRLIEIELLLERESNQ